MQSRYVSTLELSHRDLGSSQEPRSTPLSPQTNISEILQLGFIMQCPKSHGEVTVNTVETWAKSDCQETAISLVEILTIILSITDKIST